MSYQTWSLAEEVMYLAGVAIEIGIIVTAVLALLWCSAKVLGRLW